MPQRFISTFIFITLFFSVSIIKSQTENTLLRYPSINHNGTQIAFSYQGDIWKANVDGSNVTRLTIHEAYESTSLWSNDGSKIAFNSNRWGNNDIFVISANGGTPKRITYHSTSDALSDWTNNNEILFYTSRIFRQVEWDFETATVSANGGTPKRLLDAVGSSAVASDNGRFIAYVKGYNRVAREAYKGSADRDIWIYDTKNNTYKQLTTFTGNDFNPKWKGSTEFYFISASSGKYNIHKANLDDSGNLMGGIESITSFVNESIRYFDISKDGSTIIAEALDANYLINTANNSARQLNIKIGTDYRFDPIEHKNFSKDATEFAVSPNGKYSVFTVRGEIFVKENNKDKSRSVNLSKHSYRDQHPQWLNDSTVIFVSDRTEQNDLYAVFSSDKKESNIFKSLKHKTVRLTTTDLNENWPIVSPNGKQVAYEVGRGKLVVSDVDAETYELTNHTTMLDGWAIPGSVSWSPDSKWLAYSLNDLEFNSDIFIQPVNGKSESINISMHPRNDFNPVWSADGSKLAFSSDRNNRNADVWFAWLNETDWQKTKQDWDDADEPKKDDKKKDDKKDKDKTKIKPIKIDTKNIYKRLVQVTSKPGDESNVAISKDGKTFYFTSGTSLDKGSDLFSIKWDGKDVKQITKGGKNPSGLLFDKKHKFLYMKLKGGKLARLKDGKDKTESLSFNAKMIINHTEEKNQIFEDAWGALNIGFYDPNFHGQNWDELKTKYKPLVLSMSTKDDFRYMFNNMLGELNASHMGMYGKGREETQKESTGLLGIEVEPLSDGVKVMHIVPNSPADKEKSKLQVSDIIQSVNGKKIYNDVNFYSLLSNAPDEKVLLGVKNKNGNFREVIIRPTKSIRANLYDEWVDQRKELVNEYSNGKLGYLHIKAMGWSSFERFEREMTASGYGKEGIVIDVRYNGGGWTTDFLMTVLNYKQHAYTIPRGASKNLATDKKSFRPYYPLGERLPYSAWTKPSIALCNENSYSNAEIFSHAFKNLGIGSLVGMPTFGAVISTGSHSLIDGSRVRMPFRGWFVLESDDNMDFVPAVPDFILDNSPDSKSMGKDEQLKKAVDELLKQLD